MDAELISKRYVNGKVELYFTSHSAKGQLLVTVDSMTSPQGVKGVGYDCFLPAVGRWLTQGIDEAEFISDMLKVISLIVEQPSSNRNIDIITDGLLRDHIAKSGRLIDSDLCTYVTEVYLGMNAFSENENGKHLDTTWRERLLDKMFMYAENNFGQYLYVTQYRRTAFGLQPILVSFNELKNRRR